MAVKGGIIITPSPSSTGEPRRARHYQDYQDRRRRVPAGWWRLGMSSEGDGLVIERPGDGASMVYL